MKTVSAVLFAGLLVFSSAVQANTVFVDFAGATYGPPVLADGFGADPPAALNYNVYDPPATQGDGTFRFQTPSAGFLPAGTQVNMIANLQDTTGSLTGIGLDGIYNGGSLGIARDTYTGAAFGGFAPEALQDMIFISANRPDAFVFVLTDLATDGTTYTLTFASGRNGGVPPVLDGGPNETLYTVNSNTQSIDVVTSPGTVAFNNILPDVNGDIRIDIGDPSTGVGYVSAMKIESSAGPVAQPGDFDADGDVDGADFVVWQTNFPTASGAMLDDGDADGDGDVDGADFVVWQTNFPFTPGPSAAPVPEPAAWMLALLALGSLGMARRIS